MDHDWVKKLPWPEIHYASRQYGIDYKLIAAMVFVESGGNRHAMRCELSTDPATKQIHMKWKYPFQISQFASMNGITNETEEICQATSWGLMQVMGTVARELGHSTHLCELTDARLGLHYGCSKLKSFQRQYGNDKEAVAAYNAGSARYTKPGTFVNERYVDKVFGYHRDLDQIY